jgi:tetratricopeptide (TPR) repeat protein
VTSHPFAPVAAGLLALTLAFPARAAVIGDTVEATCSAGTKGDITNGTVTIVCGIPHEQVAEYMRLAVSGRPGDHTELLHRLDAMIPASSQLRAEALVRFFTSLGEADVPPEQLTTKLVKIAQHYQELLARLEKTSSADPEVRQLKEKAAAALDAGDFTRTEELLNQAKTRDLAAIEQMQVDLEARKFSAAEAAAENGSLMMTQLRHADAARYYSEAVRLVPEGFNTYLIQYLSYLGTAWSDAGDYQQAVKSLERALMIGEQLAPMFKMWLGSTDHFVVPMQEALCEAYIKIGDFDNAEKMCVVALHVIEQTASS